MIHLLMVLIVKLAFLGAGLTPPEVTVEWHTMDDCPVAGMGMHKDGHITMCDGDLGTLAHEMSHAWIDQNTRWIERRQYMALYPDKLMAWRTTTVPWAFRGTEHAAETLRWGIGFPIKRTSDTPEQRAIAFDLISGGSAR